MELGPEDVSLLERCPHFSRSCVQELDTSPHPQTFFSTPLFHLCTNFLKSDLDSSEDKSLKNIPFYRREQAEYKTIRYSCRHRGAEFLMKANAP